MRDFRAAKRAIRQHSYQSRAQQATQKARHLCTFPSVHISQFIITFWFTLMEMPENSASNKRSGITAETEDTTKDTSKKLKESIPDFDEGNQFMFFSGNA